MKNPLSQLIKAYYNTLKDAVGVPIFDSIAPHNSGSEYILIGDRNVVQNQDKDHFHTEVVVLFQIVTKGQNTGLKRANEISNKLLELVDSDHGLPMPDFTLDAQVIESINNLAGLDPTDKQFSVLVRVRSYITEGGFADGGFILDKCNLERNHGYAHPVSYCGITNKGIGEDEEFWKITRITVAPNGTVTERAVANMVNWVDYLTHTYTIL